MPKAMIVSPSEEFSALMATMLELEDYAVANVDWTAVEMSVEEFRDEKPDVLIVDIGFPLPHLQFDFRGLAILDKLLDASATKDVAIVAFSIVLDELFEQRERLRKLGIPVVGNPYDLDEFAGIIRSTLGSNHILTAA